MPAMKYKKDGVWHRLPGNIVSTSEAFTVKDGLVCTEVGSVQVGGVNALGVRWRQEEAAEALEEPYLNEWGYKCCLDECTEENHGQPVEVYKWLYRCMKEGFSVPTRTIVVTGADGVERPCVFQTEEVLGDGVDVNSWLTEKMALDTALELEYDFDAKIFNIPLIQFPDLTYTQIKRYVDRVKRDNPELLYPFWPATFGEMAVECEDAEYEAVYGAYMEGTVYRHIFSVRASDADTEKMLDACKARAAVIKDKICRYYGIVPGDKLSVEQRKKVVKVIHDDIILNSRYDGVESYPLVAVMASGLDGVHLGSCQSYTDAFNYVARMYGIEALYMTGESYQGWNGKAYEFTDTHAWVLLSLTDTYGEYSADPADWTCIDVYWDEGKHSGNEAADTVDWEFFMDCAAIFPDNSGEVHSSSEHVIHTLTGYGKYPFDHEAAVPSASYPYKGSTPYVWDE